ncbi:partial Type-1 restriction enzyme EcoKI specificity protein, partial [uncultured bacterium]
MKEGALHELPAGWVWTTLGEISWVTKLAGFEFTKYFNYKEFGDIRVVRGLNIGFGDFKAKDFKYIDSSISNVLTRSQLYGGELLIAYVGSLGKVAILPKDKYRYHLGPNVGKIVIDDVIGDARFVKFFLLSVAGQDLINSKSKAVAQSSISMQQIRSFSLALPPLPEQRAIISKIEQLFSDLDNGIDNFKKARAQLKLYRQSVLKAACEGRLVPTEAELARAEGREYEAADVLLARILKERRERWNGKGKYKEAEAPDTNVLSPTPEGWCLANVGDVIEPSSEKIDPLKIQEMPYIGLEHIEKDTGELLGQGRSNDVRSTKTRFYSGDLLYGKLRPYLNKVYVADFDGICSTDILVFSKNPYASSKYLSFRFLCGDFVRYANRNVSGVQHPRVD